MYKTNKIGIVIPTYKVKKELKNVIDNIPNYVDKVVIVNDNCPQNSYTVIDTNLYENVQILHHKINQGVGGAVFTGYKKLLESDIDIIVKIDGDGQMDCKYLPSLLDPIINNESDYTKGNRFKDFKDLKKMPKSRLFGNSILSFVVKSISGYWNVMDPTNGYTAIKKTTLKNLIDLPLSKRYFFETDMLIHLNIESAVAKDIAIPAIYGDEESNLKIIDVLKTFPKALLKGFFKRIFYKYYLYDFNMGSIFLFLGTLLTIFGILFGSYHWINGILNQIENTTGTIMLTATTLILGIQFLLSFINIDINNVPKK